MKKRKLNSKNPKYMDKSQLKEKKVIKRVLICTTPSDVKSMECGMKTNYIWKLWNYLK